MTTMNLRKPYKPFRMLLLLLAGITFFSCHDSIYEDINKESSIGEDRIKGGATSFVKFNGCIYVAPTNEGVIYRKPEVNCYSRGGWEAVSCPNTPIFLAEEGGILYMLTTIFKEGSGDFEGINLPNGFYEYISSTGNSDSWFFRASYVYDKEGTHIPSRYKNQHTKVRPNGSSSAYSIDTNSNVLYWGNTAILLADQNDVQVGSWWCLAGTSDQLIMGTSTGLYHMQIGSTDINDDVAPNTLSTAKSIFGGMTILALYVAGTTRDSTGAWSCSGQPEINSVIYAFATGPGSAYAAQNGLYSYIPGLGWDSEY